MMKIFSLILTLFFGFEARSASVDLKLGDILLQPLYCWTCSLIEAEENSIYSHIGIVVQVNPEVLVAESWSLVKLTPLDEFKKRTEKNQAILVRRYRNERISHEFVKQEEYLKALLKEEFLGKKYDHAFRWNNFDSNGDQLYYCSELVSKLLQAFLGIEGPIKRMVFKVNTDEWVRYFRGPPPVGEWGNSPGDYEKSDLLYDVGEL